MMLLEFVQRYREALLHYRPMLVAMPLATVVAALVIAVGGLTYLLLGGTDERVVIGIVAGGVFIWMATVVWSVWYSNKHRLTPQRGGTLEHIGDRERASDWPGRRT